MRKGIAAKHIPDRPEVRCTAMRDTRLGPDVGVVIDEHGLDMSDHA